jgi:hypothetical protein
VAQRFQRCGKCIVLNSALAAEVALYWQGMSFFATSSAMPSLLQNDSQPSGAADRNIIFSTAC